MVDIRIFERVFSFFSHHGTDGRYQHHRRRRATRRMYTRKWYAETDVRSMTCRSDTLLKMAMNLINEYYQCDSMQWKCLRDVHSRVRPSHGDDSCQCKSLIHGTADCQAILVLFHRHICCPKFVQLICEKHRPRRHRLLLVNCIYIYIFCFNFWLVYKYIKGSAAH